MVWTVCARFPIFFKANEIPRMKNNLLIQMQIGEIDCERSTSSLIVLSGISFHLLTWCFRLMTSGASSHWHTGLLMVSISGSEEGQSCMVLMGMACQLPPHTELPSGPLLRRHALAIVYCLYSQLYAGLQKQGNVDLPAQVFIKCLRQRLSLCALSVLPLP